MAQRSDLQIKYNNTKSECRTYIFNVSRRLIRIKQENSFSDIGDVKIDVLQRKMFDPIL